MLLASSCSSAGELAPLGEDELGMQGLSPFPRGGQGRGLVEPALQGVDRLVVAFRARAARPSSRAIRSCPTRWRYTARTRMRGEQGGRRGDAPGEGAGVTPPPLPPALPEAPVADAAERQVVELAAEVLGQRPASE